jgi:streptogramin lyase
MRPAAFLAFSLAFGVFAGCASHASPTIFQGTLKIPQSKSGPGHDVKQGGPKPITWVQLPSNLVDLTGVVVGPDKNLWFHDSLGGLTSMTMTGSTTEFPLTCFGNFLTVGADGNFYSACDNPFVSQVTPTGVEHDYPIPSGDSTFTNGITTGPDGNVWFTEGAHVAVVTPNGNISEYLYPSGTVGNTNDGITSGPDGRIWFTEDGGQYVDSIDPGTRTIVQHNSGCGGAEAIVSAPDGNLYHDCGDGQIVQMSTDGNILSIIPQPWGYDGNVQDLTIGPDKAVWFVASRSNFNIIGEYNYLTQTVTAYVPPNSSYASYAITAGPDGNIWATSRGDMNVYVLKVLTVSPRSLKFARTGQVLSVKVTENGTYHWTVQSSNTLVATVAKGPNAHTFEVTSVGSGTCVLTIADNFGNSFNVNVKVL